MFPQEWEVRFFDENVGVPTDEDYQWADAVFASGSLRFGKPSGA
jgi:hypothetical protein